MPGKIKVLECIRQGQIGGGESHLLSLVENLDKSRYEPLVLSFTDGPMIDRLKQMNIPVYVIPTTRPFDISKWRTVKKFIAEQKVSLVHAHGTRAASNVLQAAQSLKLPLIYTIHGWSFHPDQKSLVRRVRILGEKYLTSRSSLNISVSASNQQTGKDEIGKGFNSVVVNNGIDLRKFNPQQTHGDIRKELNIPEDTLLVLFIARFTSHKQPMALLQAFADALPKNPKLHLLMVGDGDQKEEALAFVRSKQLEKNTTLLPFRLDVPDVLAAADIFVLPSLWEGLPIGLLEAMAMGKAIIASRVDGTKEILQHGVNGWMVEPGNQLVPQLTEALLLLAADEEKRKAFSEAAINTVTERFNAIAMTRQIEGLYEEVLRGV